MTDRSISLEGDRAGSESNQFLGSDRAPAGERKDYDPVRLGSPVSRALLLLLFLGLFFVSLMIVSDVAINFHISTYGRKEGVAAILALTAVIAGAFVFSRFSFGYQAGFYLFAMMAGYFWLNIFGTLGYDRHAALISAIASIILFLAPVLLITRPARRFFTLPHAVLDLLPVCILCLSAVVFLLTALNGVRLVGLTDMYKYRDTLNHPHSFEYFVGTFYGALLPFAFACSLARKRWLMLLALCALSLLFYTVTLTKVSLFVSSLLIFFAILSAYFESRAAVILSLLIPTAVGLLARPFNSGIAFEVFGFLSFRMLAIPSISLDHYYVFFADHPLTHFCQLWFMKGIMDCPYSDQLGIVLSNWFRLGNLNASLFATEGVASVGPLFAPISALVCGLVLAVGNNVSAGLPKPFIFVSAAAIPHILLNVPLATTLLSHGLGLLFLLWYVTPPDYFERRQAAPEPAVPVAASPPNLAPVRAGATE
jgi:hypothetical protein